MPASLSAAIHRFRRRLAVAAFVRGASSGLLVGGVLACGILLAVRLLPDAVPDGMHGLGVVGWPHWLLAAGATLLGGVARAARIPFDDGLVLQHLERRLGTGGLLLACADGVELDDRYTRQLACDLARVPTVLPAIRVRPFVLRPLLASLVLLVLHALPPVALPSGPGGATGSALADLEEQVAQLTALPETEPETAAELRSAVRELAERVAAGDLDVWREIDELRRRIDRERSLGDGAHASESPTGESPSQAAVDGLVGELAKAAAEFAADGLLDKLPDGVAQAMAEAAAGALAEVDLDSLRELLPDDPEQLLAMAESVARLAEQFGLGESPVDGTEQPGQVSPGAPALGRQSMQRMAELARDLGSAAQELARGLAGLGADRSQAGDHPAHGGRPAGGGREGGVDGGGHVALRLGGRLTEPDAEPERALELPGGDLDPAQLPSEWQPVDSQDAAPAFDGVIPSRPAPGTAPRVEHAGASWQLRLRPRHREVVRRFFSQNDK